MDNINYVTSIHPIKILRVYVHLKTGTGESIEMMPKN